MSSENKFSANFTMHQNPNDAANYTAHTEDALELFDSVGLPGLETANANSIYGNRGAKSW